MEALTKLPVVPLLAALVALLGLFAVLRKTRGKGKRPRKGASAIPGVDKLLKEGRYLEAGRIALEAEHPEEALEYFLRAQQPARAAAVAAQLGRARQAAELYERSGNRERAAHHYEEAGNPEKAAELRRQITGRAGVVKASSERSPGDLVRQKQADFETAKIDAGKDDVRRAQAQRLGAQAAEALLASGDIMKAAETYRDAELFDEAIHLYANVLALPGEAAPLVAKLGNHERAAELYEIAGMKERAAAAWSEIGLNAAAPESYYPRIERLSEVAALKFLEDATILRPIDGKSAELHYLLGVALQRKMEMDRAHKIFQGIIRAVGEYKDVSVRIDEIKVGRVRPASSPGSGRAPVEIVMEVPVIFDADLGTDEISSLAEEDVAAAEVRAQRLAVVRGTPVQGPPSAGLEPTWIQRTARPTTPSPPPDEPLIDSDVEAAKNGPSIESLRAYIGNSPCDLGNIEVFYRLGLAYVAAGKWTEALSAFERVEEASPGYRDAQHRGRQIREWQKTLADSLTNVGLEGTLIRKPKQEAPRYSICGELGRGGIAIVYRAVDSVLGREVALKFLSDTLVSGKEVRDMFEREARSVAQLNHPNIVTIYDFGALEGRAFIAMEYVEGGTVRQLIQEGGKLGTLEALRIITQLLDALEYAHARKIIHRDIKPSNVMRTSSGLVKLMDFGLAKSISGDARASVVAGTPAYMAPEQMLGSIVDGRADLFAVGASLYEMLTGTLPFQGLDRLKPPRRLREHNPNIPRLIEEVVLRSVELDPERRFQTAGSMAAPLKTVLQRAVAHQTGDLKSGDLPQMEIVPPSIFST